MNSKTRNARAVAQTPIPMDTPERSQTRRSTVKSLKTDGSDFIFLISVNDRRALAIDGGALVKSADARQCPNEPGAEFVEFPLVVFGKNAEHPVALGSHLQL